MRRGHGSTKVPGVKLRPAAPTKSRKPGEPSAQLTRLHSSIQDDVDSTEILRSCWKLLVGVVICGSGLSDKVNLYQQASHISSAKALALQNISIVWSTGFRYYNHLGYLTYTKMDQRRKYQCREDCSYASISDL
ncbi:DPB11_5 [Sanghuangporus weigelae]